MKMLINSPETVVADALRGMAAAHPELNVDVERRVVVRRDAREGGRVGLVSGGGSGHEPLHAGFVGYGMLSAACPGEVFTSPVPDQMLRAASAVEAGQGVLFVVKNYTGDVLNFQMAAELAEEDGVRVEQVLVNDDVAVTDSLYTAGRRGTGATLFVEKIAGAAAEEGAPLERGGRDRPAGQRILAQLRRGAQRLHHSRERQPDLRPAGRGDGTRDRDPRRAGPRAARDDAGPRDRGGRRGRRTRRAGGGGSGRRAGTGPGQRDGSDAAAGAVRVPRRGARGCWRPGACRSRGRSSATTSPRWTWRAVRCRCAGPTRKCCGCGTRPCRPPRCAGAADPEVSSPKTTEGPFQIALKRPLAYDFEKSGRQDLNLRPLDPQSSALPSCATSRCPSDLGFPPAVRA